MQVETESKRSSMEIDSPSVAIVGGGLAGLSATVEALERGARVVIFERKRRLGGRAASIDFGVPSATADVGQHLFLGCCERLRRLNAFLGLDDCFDPLESIPFLTPNDAKKENQPQFWNLAAVSWLPIKYQYLPAFLSFSPLTYKERWNLLSFCRKIASDARSEVRTNDEPNDGLRSGSGASSGLRSETFGELLQKSGVSQKTIDAFWRPFVLSATAEPPEIAASDAVKCVFGESFGQGKRGAAASLPNRSLREIYHVRALEALRKRGVDVRFFSRVSRFETRPVDFGREDGPREIVGIWDGDRCESFDKYVLAVDPFEARDILERSDLPEIAETVRISQYEYGAITAVHFWLDRPLTEKRAVVLADGPAQWFFRSANSARTTFPSARPDSPRGFYFQALISGSHRILPDDEMVARGKDALIERVWKQLSRSFPDAAPKTNVLAARVSTTLDAVISPSPKFFRARPSQKTVVANLALAGDWTATELPSSMESAVLSGRRAVDALF